MEVNKIVYGDKTLIDLTNDTVNPDVLERGATAHDASGKQIVGNLDVIDLSQVTVTEDKMIQGTVAVNSDGEKIVGTFVPPREYDFSELTATPETILSGKVGIDSTGAKITGIKDVSYVNNLQQVTATSASRILKGFVGAKKDGTPLVGTYNPTAYPGNPPYFRKVGVSNHSVRTDAAARVTTLSNTYEDGTPANWIVTFPAQVRNTFILYELNKERFFNIPIYGGETEHSYCMSTQENGVIVVGMSSSASNPHSASFYYLKDAGYAANSIAVRSGRLLFSGMPNCPSNFICSKLASSVSTTIMVDSRYESGCNHGKIIRVYNLEYSESSDSLSTAATAQIVQLPQTCYVSDVAYGNGKWVVVPYDLSYIFYSTNDGASFSQISSPIAMNNFRNSVFFTGEYFFLIAGSESKIYYSSDGTSWMELVLSVHPLPCSNVLYVDGWYVFVASDHPCLYMTNDLGTTYMQELYFGSYDYFKYCMNACHIDGGGLVYVGDRSAESNDAGLYINDGYLGERVLVSG